MNSSNQDKDKILIAFDLDNTILSKSADYEVINMLPKEILETELKEPEIEECDWVEYMDKVYSIMKERNITIDQVKEAVENIPLTEGFEEVFDLMDTHKDRLDSIIISGSNTLYVKWVMEHYKLDKIFSNYYSNLAEEDQNNLIKIKHIHYHSCRHCDRSICKRILFQKHVIKYNLFEHKHVFVGDGGNDFCPPTIFREKDILLPREGYHLYNMLFKQKFKNNLLCKIHPWTSGREIVNVLKKIL